MLIFLKLTGVPASGIEQSTKNWREDWKGMSVLERLRTPTNCRATRRSDLLKFREHCNTLHADTIEYHSHQAENPYLELSWQYVS